MTKEKGGLTWREIRNLTDKLTKGQSRIGRSVSKGAVSGLQSLDILNKIAAVCSHLDFPFIGVGAGVVAHNIAQRLEVKSAEANLIAAGVGISVSVINEITRSLMVRNIQTEEGLRVNLTNEWVEGGRMIAGLLLVGTGLRRIGNILPSKPELLQTLAEPSNYLGITSIIKLAADGSHWLKIISERSFYGLGGRIGVLERSNRGQE